MAKVSKARLESKFNKALLKDQPLVVSSVSSDYGFDKPVISLSIMEALTGRPVKDVTNSKIKVTAISAPNGWSLKKKMQVSPVYNKVDGFYTFTISDKGNDLKKGPYTLAIHVITTAGKNIFRGQCILQLRVK